MRKLLLGLLITMPLISMASPISQSEAALQSCLNDSDAMKDVTYCLHQKFPNMKEITININSPVIVSWGNVKCDVSLDSFASTYSVSCSSK